MDPNNKPPHYHDITDAARRLAGLARKTPLIRSAFLSDTFNAKVFLKAESLQHTGSFKFRGAFNFISQLTKHQKSKGLVAYSSGNHAHAVAKAASLERINSTIVMPSDAPSIKVEATKKFGSKVVFYERNTESREDIAAKIVKMTGGVLIPPYDHPLIIAGQGTVGLEIINQMNDLDCKPDVVLVPCSGGGLIAGIAMSIKNFFPKSHIHPVEPEDFDDTARSLESGKIEIIRENKVSICDALLVNKPGQLSFSINRNLLSRGLTVSDKMIERAMAFAFKNEKLVLEPGGAAALAAILDNKINLSGKNVVVVLSGGNVDPNTFKKILEHY
ncbi:MAG: threonine/serine dehydratase [Pseudomonadota bacterium]|nr:threonine/serine dehydratase [Pseudomonadota bacterium]